MGARDKPYTRAKGTSHIRVTLKDDTLGLGAKLGPNAPQPGLDAFQGLLGRLNGRSDAELAAQQKARDYVRGQNYVESRWGALRFVSGGLLVGDRAEETQQPQETDSTPVIKALPTPAGSNFVSLEGSDKAKKTLESTVDDFHTATVVKQSKKSKLKKQRSARAEPSEPLQAMEDLAADKPLSVPASRDESEMNSSETDRARRRAEKAQRKIERRARKEAKRTSRNRDSEEPNAVMTKPGPQKGVPPVVFTEERSKAISLPAKLERGGRHAVRQRYIQQKKMAMTDAGALNEVGWGHVLSKAVFPGKADVAIGRY